MSVKRPVHSPPLNPILGPVNPGQVARLGPPFSSQTFVQLHAFVCKRVDPCWRPDPGWQPTRVHVNGPLQERGGGGGEGKVPAPNSKIRIFATNIATATKFGDFS